jgi:hypothetical protein
VSSLDTVRERFQVGEGRRESPRIEAIKRSEHRGLTMARTGAAEADFSWLLGVFNGGPVTPSLGQPKQAV